RLTAPVPDEHAAPGTPDDEVLRAPSCLDPLRVLARLLADSRPGAPVPPGLLGVFGYELVDRWEELGPRRPDPIDEPDYAFVLVGDAVVYDEASGQVTAVVRGLPWERAQDVDARLGRLEHLGRPDPSRRPGGVPGAAATAIAPSSAARTVEPAAFEPAFGAAVETLLSHIAAGDVYQAVLSRSVALPSTAPPFAVLRALGTDAPFRFFVDLADGALIGASPETCLAVEDGVVELRPLAGTVPRGADADLDQRLAVQLLLDDKEQAEHAMLVDLARNDVARCSLPGSTELSEAFTLLRMSRVQHLASCVRGRLRSGLDALHAYRAVANMGTLTGAPKPMAMALVRGLEPTARGFYGGAIAFLAGDGTLTSCIAIRTLRHVRGQDCYHARAGAGVVHDSVPGNEFLETEHKLAQLRRAVQEALA
ncbi:MAG: anthranilate synthase component I family protein, partial [Planctomycetes bacterium]|nr:anthranilate synthase component I family protein [Planctomycetota bacterium]